MFLEGDAFHDASSWQRGHRGKELKELKGIPDRTASTRRFIVE